MGEPEAAAAAEGDRDCEDHGEGEGGGGAGRERVGKDEGGVEDDLVDLELEGPLEESVPLLLLAELNAHLGGRSHGGRS